MTPAPEVDGAGDPTGSHFIVAEAADPGAPASAEASGPDTRPAPELSRGDVVGALRAAADPRGLKSQDLLLALGANQKTRHRVRRLIEELLEDGTAEKVGTRYRLTDWAPPLSVPAPAPVPAAAAREATARPEVPAVAAGAILGRILVHPSGFGFVEREDGEDNVYIAARHRGGALDRDRVAIATWLGHRGTEGRVVAVLERGRAKLTGIVRAAGRVFYLAADDPRLLGTISLEGKVEHASLGQAVVAEILEYPTVPDGPVRARILRVLGDPDDPRTEVQKILECDDIPDEFPADVRAEAAHAPKTVGDAALRDLEDREDLRHLPFLTIDPETARDFDDAVCLEDGPRGATRLWVAVADVSHYVRPGTALDREAQLRGVSVYLPNRAIPMLPHELSSDICSLNPDVERLSMVARIDLEPSGEVRESALMAAVIRSRARLDYAGVAAALAGDLRGSKARYAPHLPALERMMQVSALLRARRQLRGSLDFDLPEAVVVLDQDDPRRVRTVQRARSLPEVKRAYAMIEDFMLAANEAVARYFASRGLDALWRIHAAPRTESIERFAALAQSFGLQFSAEDAQSPPKLRTFLKSLEGQPAERALSYLLLRAMKQAIYSIDNVGHFGLAAAEYLHFTSPIRRYPDLLTHRLLKLHLRHEGKRAGRVDLTEVPSRDALTMAARTSSQHERRAMQVERQVVDMYRVFLMRDRVGEDFEGTISGITAVGLFVELDDPFVEGLIRADSLGREAYSFDEKNVRLFGERSGQSFALSDRVRVRIENVSVPRRKIELSLLEHLTALPVSASGGRPPGRRAAGPRTVRKLQTEKRELQRGRPSRGGRPGAAGGRPGGPKKPGKPRGRR